MSNNKDTMPERVYVNRQTKKLVDENYPNSEEYIRKDIADKGKQYMDELSFIGNN